MSVPARLEYAQRGEDRSALRRKLRLGSALGGSGEEAVVHDLSVTGFRIETSAELRPRDMLELDLPEAGPTSAHVIWKRARFYGCRFDAPVSPAVISAALLRSAHLPAKDEAVSASENDEALVEDEFSRENSAHAIAELIEKMRARLAYCRTIAESATDRERAKILRYLVEAGEADIERLQRSLDGRRDAANGDAGQVD